MYLTNNHCLSVSAFSESWCKEVIKNAENLKIQKASIQDGNNNNRSSRVAWIKENEELYKSLENIIYGHNAKAGWNFDIREFEPFQYTIYEKGDHYNWHIDSHTKPYNNGSIRKISFTLCLNDEYEGGQFEIASLNPKGIDQNIRFDKKFTIGTVISFPSFSWHKVHPVTKGTRKVLVGWIVGPSFV